MKLTRRELKEIIKSELLSEADLRASTEVRFDYELPRCNFEMPYEFKEFLESINKGGKKGADYPTWISPAFTSAFTKQFAPYLNAMVMPMFGIEAKCKFLQEMLNTFAQAKKDYDAGVKDKYAGIRTGGNVEKAKEFEKAIVNSYPAFRRKMPDIIAASRVSLKSEQESSVIASPPPGVTPHELFFVTMMFGNLDKISDNRSEASAVYDRFKKLGGNLSADVSDFENALKPSHRINSVDASQQEQFFDTVISAYRTDGHIYLIGYINLLLNDLKKQNIIPI